MTGENIKTAATGLLGTSTEASATGAWNNRTTLTYA